MTPLQSVDFIVVHCSATKPGQKVDAAEIRRWHVEERHWDDIGYHRVGLPDGTYEDGRSLEYAGAHVKGYNSRSIGICLVGGLDEDGNASGHHFTETQLDALLVELDYWTKRYPKALVVGHRDLLKDGGKECPCFDVQKWYYARAPFAECNPAGAKK